MHKKPLVAGFWPQVPNVGSAGKKTSFFPKFLQKVLGFFNVLVYK